ncbi:replication initiator protein A [Pirellulales bacterium]|nr:replication initiator protein A [Pirellulales bacterium]
MKSKKDKTRRRQRTRLADFWDGRDEMNLAEWSLCYPNESVPRHVTQIQREDEIHDEAANQYIRRKVVVEGSLKHGLLTPLDIDVLSGLIQLSHGSGFGERTLHFVRRDLIGLLGWKDQGWSYGRIQKALYRLDSNRINFSAWRDNKAKVWRERGSFGLIDNFKIRDSRLKAAGGSYVDELSEVTWGDVLFESFSANYLRRINFRVLMGLSKAAAKQAYRFLDKHFYHRPELSYELPQFACEKIGLCKDRDLGRLKAKTSNLLQELVDIGFIESPEFEKAGKRWYITLRQKGNVAKNKATEKNGGDTGYAAALTNGEDRETVKEMDREINAYFGPLNPNARRAEEGRAFSRWEKANPQLVMRLQDWKQSGGKPFETLKREILYEYAAGVGR